MATCDPKTLPGQATCFRCIDRGQLEPINLWILWNATGDALTAAQVAAAAAPYRPFDHHQYLAAKAYLLAVITGSSTTPSTLMQLAACYSCIPKSERRNVETFLLASGSGVTTDPGTLSRNSAQFRGIEQYEEAVLYFLAQLAGMQTPGQVMTGAACFQCLTNDQLETLALYLECLGLAANIIPPGSKYTGGTPEFDVAIQPNTYYRITWGANDVSATVCGNNYTSAGAGTSVVFYSGSCTLLQLFGTSAGTTVTALVVPFHFVKVPPSKFTFVNALNGTVTATWDTPPSGVIKTELWTSNDGGVTYSLAQTVNAPGTSVSYAGPGGGYTLYGKARWIYSDGGNGGFTNPVSDNGVVDDWVTRIQNNGGAKPSGATIAAVNTFANSMTTAGIDALMYTAIIIPPDSLIAALTPLYKTVGNGNDPWTNHGFVAGDLGTGGLGPNNGTKYLDSGFNCQAAFGNSTAALGGLSLYCMVSGSQVTTDFGAQNSTGGSGCVFYVNLSGNTVANMWANGTVQISVAANGKNGFYSAVDSAFARRDIYFANSTTAFASIGNNTNNQASGPDTHSMILFGYNANGTPTPQGTRTFSFAAIHKPLTSAQCQNLYNAVQALRTAFGGGFA